MKIAFRISSMQIGGAERVFLSVAKILQRDYKANVQFVVDKIGTGETESLVKANGFDLIGLSSSRTLKSIIPLKNYLNLEKPDILISAYTETNVGAIIAGKLASHDCKVIVSEHSSLHEHWQYATFMRRMLLNLYVKFGYRFADHVLAVSKGIASQLHKMGLAAKSVSYIYNPIRFNLKKTNDGSVQKKLDEPTILAVGRIAKQKDYLTLLKAFQVVVKGRAARLLIVGGVHEVVEKAKLDDYIQSNDLSAHVEFVGFTDNMQTYYERSDIFVLSSAWEGFGNVIVEALAFGLPVVSTDCNHGPAEILLDEKYGKLVPVGNSHVMAKAICDTLDHNPFPREGQINRAGDFCELSTAKKYHLLFQQVLAAS